MSPIEEKSLNDILEIQLKINNENSEFQDKFLNRISGILNRLEELEEKAGESEDFERENLLEDLNRELDGKIENTYSVIEYLVEKIVPEPAMDLHNYLIDGFEIYYDGLLIFKEFIETENEELPNRAIEALINANEIFKDADQQALSIEEEPISTTIY